MLKRHQPGNPCDCRSALDCLQDKCVLVTFHNVDNDFCECCTDFLYLKDGTEYSLGPVGYNLGDNCECLIGGGLTLFSASDPSLDDSDCGCWDYVNIGFGYQQVCHPRSASLIVDVQLDGFYPGGFFPHGTEIATFGYSGFDDTSIANVRAAFAALCAGETITLPFKEIAPQFATPFCDFSDATVSVRLVTGEGCDTYPFTCSTLADCGPLPPLEGSITGFEDCTIPDDGMGHAYVEARTYSTLNADYIFTCTLSLDPSLVECVTAAQMIFQAVSGDYTSADQADRYLDPGPLWETYTYTGAQRIERYVAAIILETECSGGEINITKVRIAVHDWAFDWDGMDYTVFSSYSGVVCHDFFEYTPTAQTGTPPVMCASPTSGEDMSADFEYDKCGSTDTFTVTAFNFAVG